MRKVTLTINMEPKTDAAANQEALNIGKLCRKINEALQDFTAAGCEHKIAVKIQDTEYATHGDTAEILFMPHVIIVQ
ncbi:ribosomal protein L11 [Filimonas zeae]|uniref:Uncharacterized protein n=1 Tax=Filimonas zeae TaxID=1737353 RepID=A0A917J2D7_9BACT|nr:hypothetical protein [Filimonas zeae]MDR6340369.1 ribosomal protein L11 [Filimonas zeae]GGH72420.1 hypothetical protein GCM10011379_32820 [Filimonas zeae]